MESYIVRVYRRGRNNPNEVAGLVETVGSNEKNAFQSFSGLITAIRRALGEDDSGVSVDSQARIYTDREKLLKKQQAG